MTDSVEVKTDQTATDSHGVGHLVRVLLLSVLLSGLGACGSIGDAIKNAVADDDSEAFVGATQLAGFYTENLLADCSEMWVDTDATAYGACRDAEVVIGPLQWRAADGALRLEAQRYQFGTPTGAVSLQGTAGLLGPGVISLSDNLFRWSFGALAPTRTTAALNFASVDQIAGRWVAVIGSGYTQDRERVLIFDTAGTISGQLDTASVSGQVTRFTPGGAIQHVTLNLLGADGTTRVISGILGVTPFTGSQAAMEGTPGAMMLIVQDASRSYVARMVRKAAG